MKKYFHLFSAFVLLCSCAYGQKPLEKMNGPAILARAVKGFEKVQDFTVTIQTDVKMEHVQIPPMNATMYFKRPDKTHFSSQGFLLLPREGVSLNPAVVSERYTVVSVGTDSMDGQSFYTLQLLAKTETTQPQQMTAWIHPGQWTIAKLETRPQEGRSFCILISYELIREGLWLPYKMLVTFQSFHEGKQASEEKSSHESERYGSMRRQMPKSGSVAIRYSDYKINTGLADSLFYTTDHEKK